MKIEARSAFDYKSIKAFTHASLYKGKKPKKTFAIYIACYMALIMLLVIEMIIFSIDGVFITLFVLAILCTLLNFYLYFGYPRVQYNALHHMKNVENHFIFYDNTLWISSENNQYNGQAELQYSMISKVIETSDYLFFKPKINHILSISRLLYMVRLMMSEKNYSSFRKSNILLIDIEVTDLIIQTQRAKQALGSLYTIFYFTSPVPH